MWDIETVPKSLSWEITRPPEPRELLRQNALVVIDGPTPGLWEMGVGCPLGNSIPRSCR